MGRATFSIRALIVVVAVAALDAASMARALHQGRLAHSVREYAIGFGLVLLVLNLDVLALLLYYSKRAWATTGGRLNSTPPPLVIAGFYVAVLSVAILSVLFLTKGRF
jgi:hypothetical protein